MIVVVLSLVVGPPGSPSIPIVASPVTPKPIPLVATQKAPFQDLSDFIANAVMALDMTQFETGAVLSTINQLQNQVVCKVYTVQSIKSSGDINLFEILYLETNVNTGILIVIQKLLIYT